MLSSYLGPYPPFSRKLGQASCKRDGEEEKERERERYRAEVVSHTLIGTRETREGWPLLAVETEVNGESENTNERGPSLGGSLGLSCRYKNFFSCLGCSSRPSKKFIFSLRALFHCICPHRPASGAGSHTGSPVSIVCVSDRD